MPSRGAGSSSRSAIGEPDRALVSNLTAEVLLRLAKAGVAALLGLIVFVAALALGEPASVPLALLCWLSGAAFILLTETSPI